MKKLYLLFLLIPIIAYGTVTYIGGNGVNLKEQSSGNTPASGNQSLYIKSSTHNLYMKNSGGTESQIGGAAITSINSDTTAAQLIVGSNHIGCTTSGGTTTCTDSGLAPSNGSDIVEEFVGHIVAPANYTYVIDEAAAYGYTINTLSGETSSGSISCLMKIGSTTVTGISGTTFSTTSPPQVATATAANSVSAGNRVTLVCSSNSSSVDLTFTIKVTR